MDYQWNRVWIPALPQRFTVICNSCSEAFNVFFWPLWIPGTHVVHTHIQVGKPSCTIKRGGMWKERHFAYTTPQFLVLYSQLVLLRTDCLNVCVCVWCVCMFECVFVHVWMCVCACLSMCSLCWFGGGGRCLCVHVHVEATDLPKVSSYTTYF